MGAAKPAQAEKERERNGRTQYEKQKNRRITGTSWFKRGEDTRNK